MFPSVAVFLSFLYVLNTVKADTVTVYSQLPFGFQSTSTSLAPGQPTPTVAAAYNDTILPAPAPPSPPTTAFAVQIPSTAAGLTTNLSIVQSGSFLGFSIEMSVVTQVIGINSSFIQVPFLNLMANIAQRGGSVTVRTGGNTQDQAVFTPDIPNNPRDKVTGKTAGNTNNPTQTPLVAYNTDYFYLLANVSALVNVNWYLGLAFIDLSPPNLDIAMLSEAILGDRLLGLQAGNEPDLYAAHGHRNQSYGPFDYFGEFGVVVQAISGNSSIPVKKNLIGPSVSGTWTPEQVWDTGFITSYQSSLGALSVEHYPDNNCFAIYGVGAPVDLPTEFASYLTHQAVQGLLAPYLNSASIAVAAGLPLLMFETNSASCGGFPGISDSFGAGLWALDYGLQMAYSNFSGAMLHVGGQNVFYNPFTPPPTNQSTFNQWTIGAVYYSALIMAEALGPTNTSQVTDLQGNSANQFTPQYAIYENGQLARVALFNYVSDPSGASNYAATLQLTAGSTPSQVSVKYFLSDSVSTKDNITWAGQTFGTQFTVDGQLKGEQNITTISCDTSANTCVIPVPAPGFALVFISSNAFSESNPTSAMTFPTTAVTKTLISAVVNPSQLANSNGHSGTDREVIGSTSKGSQSDGHSVVLDSSTVWKTLLALLITFVFAH